MTTFWRGPFRLHYASMATSIIPEDFRQNGADLIFVAAVFAALTALCVGLWRMKWLRRFILWFWRRAWGSAVTDGKLEYQTPTVRRRRQAQEYVQPMIEGQTAIILDKFEILRGENAEQHSIVAHQIADLTARVATMEERTQGQPLVTLAARMVELTARVDTLEIAQLADRRLIVGLRPSPSEDD